MIHDYRNVEYILGQRLNSPITGAQPETNARNRQLFKKVFRDFARYIITGMYKYIAGQRLNSPITGAWSEGRSCFRADKSIMHVRHEEVKTEFARI